MTFHRKLFVGQAGRILEIIPSKMAVDLSPNWASLGIKDFQVKKKYSKNKDFSHASGGLRLCHIKNSFSGSRYFYFLAPRNLFPSFPFRWRMEGQMSPAVCHLIFLRKRRTTTHRRARHFQIPDTGRPESSDMGGQVTSLSHWMIAFQQDVSQICNEIFSLAYRHVTESKLLAPEVLLNSKNWNVDHRILHIWLYNERLKIFSRIPPISLWRAPGKFLGSTLTPNKKFSNCSKKIIFVSFCSLLLC